MRLASFQSALLVVLSFTLSFVVAAQTSVLTPAQIAEFDAFVKQQMTADSVPGISVGFIKDGVMWTKGYGFADIENRSPAVPESMYRMASVNKPMTAAAVLQLVEKGKIDLDAEVQTYVPYFPKKKFPVTVRQLLGHIGGISHYRDYDKEGHFKDRKNTRQAIAVFENFDLINEPGTRYSYTSYGYNLLGAVIEGASGMPYAKYMTENVWKPLGMLTTVMDNPYEVIPNRVRGYENVDGQIRNSEFVDISSRFSAGGIRASVIDMLKFGSGFNNGSILSPKSVDLMSNSMTTKSGDITNYSAGWSTNPNNGRFVLSHSGGQQETSTFLYTFPSRKLTLAVASNLEGANTQPYIMRLFEMITGEAPNTNAYISGDRNRVPLIVAMQGTFEEGRGYFEKRGKALTDDPKELADAFVLFNQTLNAETMVTAKQQELFRTAAQGRTKLNGPFIKIGSFMSKKLNEKYGAERLLSYSTTGAITFFNDYNQLDLPAEFKFNDTIAKNAAAWHQSWSKTNNASVRRIAFSGDTDVDAVGAQLRKEFAGSDAYPNLSGPMVSTLELHVRQGSVEKAMKIADLSVDLYPGLDRSHGYKGLLLVMSGEPEKGKQALMRSIELNANGVASPGSLNTFAYNLDRIGKRDAAVELLKTAIELHPKEANLYDTLGEFYAKKEMKDKAIEYYQKALAIDAGYPNAAKAKEILQQLMAAK